MSIMFEPVNIGPMEVKNRFVHSATHESMAARAGSVTEDILKRYQRLARGQIGLKMGSDPFFPSVLIIVNVFENR